MLPSSTTKGLLPAEIDPKPRTRMAGLLPGRPEVCWICTPATLPCRAVATLLKGMSLISFKSTEATAEVTSWRFWVP